MNSFFTPNATILFYGDSVTDGDRDRNIPEDLGEAYPVYVKKEYDKLFPERKVTFLNRGISGDRTCDLLRRYEKDVLALKPDFVSILIGINDTWRRYDSADPTSAKQFRENYETLLKKIKADLPAAKIMLIQPFLLDTPPDRIAWHEDLDPKIEVVNDLAQTYGDYYLRLHDRFLEMVANGTSMESIAADGVHPTLFGHREIACKWLREMKIC